MEEPLRRCVVCIENTKRNRKIALLTLPGGDHHCAARNNNLIFHIYLDQSVNVNMIHHSGAGSVFMVFNALKILTSTFNVSKQCKLKEHIRCFFPIHI